MKPLHSIVSISWIFLSSVLLASEKVDFITHYDNTVVSLAEDHSYTYTRSYKIEVLTQDFAQRFHEVLHYDKTTQISDFVAVVSSLSSKPKKYKLKDMEDLDASGFSIAADNRAKVIHLRAKEVPYSVTVSYGLKSKGDLFIPGWRPVQGERHQVNSANFTLFNEVATEVKYNSNLLEEPTIGQTENELIWTLNDFRALEYEIHCSDWREYFPYLKLVNTNFEMHGYPGNLNDWEGFAEWIGILNQGRNDMSPDALEELKGSTQDVSDTKEKVRLAYKYLQDNMRYVSIQLGIGGWQPFTTSFVHEKKYGDCKALSFYAKSLLEALDIPSWYTLVSAGAHNKNSCDAEFASPHFNHAILTVPLENDTIWLECTSQTNPFGYLGKFTSDRNVLALTEKGGKILRTKKYQAEESLVSNKVLIEMNEFGNAKVSVDRSYTGLAIDGIDLKALASEDAGVQKRELYDELSLENFQIDKFVINPPTESVVPESSIQVKGTSTPYAKKTGNRIFFQPMNKSDQIWASLKDTESSKPIVIDYGISYKDNYELSFPEGFVQESISKAVSDETKFGKYSAGFVEKENGMVFIREVIIKDGNYPVSELPAFVDFIDSINKTRRMQVVLKSIE